MSAVPPGVAANRTFRMRVVQRVVDVRVIDPPPDAAQVFWTGQPSPYTLSPPAAPLVADAIFTQTNVSATWIATHALGRYPSVTTLDANNEPVLGEVSYPEPNVVTVTFSQPITGTMYLV